jgi:vanillate O-demethylase ferredoxin subunit
MLSSKAWSQARIEHLRDITPTVREFCLRPDTATAAWSPGAHVQIQVLVGGRPQTRSYSLLPPLPGREGEGLLRVAVKRLDQGRGGSLALWGLRVGDRLPISAPQNQFPLVPDAPAYLLAAGGIGITPLLGMVRALRAAQQPVWLLLGARSSDELAFADELLALLGADLVTASAQHGQALDLAGEIARLPAGGLFYVCGPAPMLEAARMAWQQADRPAADLRFETFGSSGRFAAQPFRLRVPRHGVDMEVGARQSLMEALHLAGVPTLFDCQRGECGLCALEVKDLQGEIDHRDVFLSAAEKAANRRICVCVSRAVGELTLDSAFRVPA